MAENDIYQLSLIFTQAGREWVNSEYYRVSVDDVTKTPTEIAQALADEWPDEFFVLRVSRCLSEDVELVQTVAQRVWPSRDFITYKAWTDKPGIITEPPLPAHSACLLQQQGEKPGRSFQGRVFLSGIPTTFETDGAINTIGETAYDTWASVPFGANSFTPIIASSLELTHANYSPKLGATAEPAPWSDVLAMNTLPQLGTQRNRTLTTSTFSTPPP